MGRKAKMREKMYGEKKLRWGKNCMGRKAKMRKELYGEKKLR